MMLGDDTANGDCLPCIGSNTASEVRSSILAQDNCSNLRWYGLQNLFGFTICVGYRLLARPVVILVPIMLHLAQRSLIV